MMRIFAIFWVIFNHTGTNGFFLFSLRPVGGAQFWAYLFVSIFCKFAVPLFLAISGALMLNRQNEPFRKWIGRIVKIVVILVVYSGLYYLYNGMRNGYKYDLWEFLIKLYSSNLSTHLWYLYLYIAYLVVLPFLRAMVKALDNKYYYYLFFIAVLGGVLPSLEFFFTQGKVTINGDLKISWLTNSVVLYPMLGFFMQHKIEIDGIKKILPTIWIMDIAGIIWSCYMTYYKGVMTGVFLEAESQTFHNSFVVINCVAIFLTIRLIFEERVFSSVLRKIILSFGGCTFGIYLWHIWVRGTRLYDGVLEILHRIKLNYMISIWIVCLIILVASYIITLVLSKIPVVKKIVGY